MMVEKYFKKCLFQSLKKLYSCTLFPIQTHCELKFSDSQKTPIGHSGIKSQWWKKIPYIWYFYFKMSFLLWRQNYYWVHTSNISTKICYLIGRLDHRADLLLHLHLRHFGRRISIFYRDSRENNLFLNSMEKYVIYFVIFVRISSYRCK